MRYEFLMRCLYIRFKNLIKFKRSKHIYAYQSLIDIINLSMLLQE